MADFTVEGIIDVDATRGVRGIKKFKNELRSLLADLKAVDKEIKKLDGRKVDIHLDADRAKAEAEQFKRDLQEINAQRAQAKLDFETAQAEAKLKKLNREIEIFDAKAAQVQVDIDAKNALREAAQLKREIESIAKSSAQVKTEMRGNAKVIANAKKLRNEVEAALKPDPEVEIDVDRRNFDRFKDDLKNFNLSPMSLGISALILAIGALIGALGPLGAALTAVGGAALGGLGVYATAFGALAAFAIPTVKDLGKAIKLLNKDTSGMDADALKEYNEALADLKKNNPLIYQAAEATKRLKKEYMEFADALKPDVLKVFNDLLKAASPLMAALFPIAQETARGIHLVTKNLEEAFEGRDFLNFMTYVQENAKRFTAGLLNTLGNFLSGFGNLIVALDPITRQFGGGLREMSRDFLRWSRTLEDNEGFQNFVDYMLEWGPKVWDFLVSFGGLLINLVRNLSPLGEALIENLDGFSDWYNELSDANPELARFATYAALAVAAIIPLVGPIVSLAPAFASFAAAVGGTTIAVGAAVALVAGFLTAMAFLSDETESYTGMMEALKNMWETAVDVAQKIWEKLKQLWDLFKDSGAIDQVQQGFERLFSAIEKLLPILEPIVVLLGVALLAAIVAVSYAFNILMFGVESLVDMFLPAMQAIVDAFHWVWDFIPGAIDSIIGFFQRLPERIGMIMLNVVNMVRDKFTQAKNAAINIVTGLRDGVVNRFEDAKSKVINIASSISTFVTDKFNWLKTNVVNSIGEMRDFVTDAFDAVKGAAEDIIGAIKRLVNWLGEKLLGPAKDVASYFSGTFQGILNGIAAAIDAIAAAAQWAADKLRELKNIGDSLNPFGGGGPSGGDDTGGSGGGDWDSRGPAASPSIASRLGTPSMAMGATTELAASTATEAGTESSLGLEAMLLEVLEKLVEGIEEVQQRVANLEAANTQENREISQGLDKLAGNVRDAGRGR